MHKYLIAALVAAIALVVAVPTTSGGQEHVAADCTATLKDGTTAVKRAWSFRHWRDRNPVGKRQERTLRKVRFCVSAKQEKELNRYAQKKKSQFSLYREYRLLTPYRCQGGAYGTWAIPCYVIACESGFSWSAYNPSGARGPYQFLGWPVPWPVRNFKDKVAHHRMGSQLGLSHWVCA